MVAGYTASGNKEDRMDSQAVWSTMRLRRVVRHDDHNKEEEAAGNRLGRKSTDWGCDDSLLAVLVELHKPVRMPYDMENNVENGHGKASPEEAMEIVRQFRRNLVLLPHAGATFPYLAVLAS